jgi:hypothetical protein
VEGTRRRDVRRCTTRHLMSLTWGGRGGVEACGGGCWGVAGGAFEEGMEEDVCFVGGERALRVDRRREFKFFVDILNKVIIVLCSVVVLFIC